ncbi:MAG: VWA domain-containing protein [Verrucomicrobia bacterium]|nr:VWA domain-containing protein [Verrucomicrobiota bacterium]
MMLLLASDVPTDGANVREADREHAEPFCHAKRAIQPLSGLMKLVERKPRAAFRQPWADEVESRWDSSRHGLQETEMRSLRCQIFLDKSASMDFGEGDANKFHYGRVLAAVLSEVMVRQHDAPGLIVFGEQARQAVPTQASRHHADEILHLLSQAQATGGTKIDRSLFQIVETFSRRGMAVVISDFFTANDTALELLRLLNAQNQESIVFHVLAPEELDLPYDGEFIFEDSETAEQLPVHIDDFRNEYQRRLSEFSERIKRECVQLEIDYQQLRTDAPLDVALMAYLERRAAV